MNWWPKSEYGAFGFLSPLPAFGATSVPIMFIIDWYVKLQIDMPGRNTSLTIRRLNRPFFENFTQDILRQADMKNIKTYYTSVSASGFWMLEYNDTFVGLIAVDASPASSPSKPTKKTGCSDTATIRHFFVEDQFRGSGIQSDLLVHAVRHAFTADPAIQFIKAADSPLVPYVRSCLRTGGFQLQKHTQKVGVYGWKLGERMLDRSHWDKAKST